MARCQIVKGGWMAKEVSNEPRNSKENLREAWYVSKRTD